MLKKSQVVWENQFSCWLKDEVAEQLKPVALAEFAANWQDHVDPKTNELNTTTLVEDVADQKGWFVSFLDSAIPDDLFDWAVDFEDVLVADGKVQAIL